jgi:hypothetical protein
MRRLVLSMIVVPIAASCACAHDLGAQCRFKGDRVELEAYFDDDTPAASAQVRVLDAERQLLVEGRTDAQGRWSFARPKPGNYRVIVDAGAGHLKKLQLTIPGDDALSTGAERVSPSAPVAVSAEPSREDFTRFPWLPLGAGVAIVCGVAVLAWSLLRLRSTNGVGRPPFSDKR